MTDAFPRSYSAAHSLMYDPVAIARQLFARMLNHKHSVEGIHLLGIQASHATGIVVFYGHKIQLDLAIFSGLLSDRTT
jgi:hypothetical protein